MIPTRPPSPERPPPSPPAEAAPAPARDAALDLLRAVALARVVAWHATGVVALTAFAAVPIMFFVAGALLGSSFDRSSYLSVLRRRSLRLLVPLWVYGAFVASVGATQARMDGVALGLDWLGIARGLSWVLPVVDPASSTWHDGWLSNHLWYLRAYFWILLLAPLLLALARRLVLSVPALLLVVGALEAARWTTTPFLQDGAARVLVGDVVAYGLFAMLGMGYARRRTSVDPRVLGIGAAACGILAIAYVRLAGLPVGGVNASYLTLTLTGVAWLLAVGAVEHPLRRFAARRAVRVASTWTSRRAVSIYLWHPAAVVVTHAIVRDRPHTDVPAVLAGTVVLTAVAVVVVGFVEDLAAGRSFPRAHLPALRGTALAPSLVVSLAVLTPFVAEPLVTRDGARAQTAAASGFRPPSYRDALTNRAFESPRDASEPTPIRLRDGRMPARQLQRALDTWRRVHPGIDSVAVALVADGKEWSGASHHRGAAALVPSEPYAVLSLTKLVTTALALRAVDDGLLQLDAPAPRIEGVRFPRQMPAITVRQLLQHTSGLVDYRSAPGSEGIVDLSPRLAVALAVRAPLLAPPGSEVHYSSTNHLYLGLLLEDLTGRPYADLVADLAAEARLTDLVVGPSPSPGWIGHAAGGVHTSQTTLARWTDALFTPGRVLPAHLVHALLTVGEHNLGLGTWPLCPCWTDTAGRKRVSGMGHHVGNGGLYHDPSGTTVSIHLEPPTGRTGAYVEDLQRLLVMVLRR